MDGIPYVPTDLEEAAAQLTSDVYVGTRLLEDLEHADLLHKRWTGEREASDV